jgi:hypothetical protein
MLQYTTVQYSIVQYSIVQYSTVQYVTVQCNAMQWSPIQYRTRSDDSQCSNSYTAHGRLEVLRMPYFNLNFMELDLNTNHISPPQAPQFCTPTIRTTLSTCTPPPLSLLFSLPLSLPLPRPRHTLDVKIKKKSLIKIVKSVLKIKTK